MMRFRFLLFPAVIAAASVFSLFSACTAEPEPSSAPTPDSEPVPATSYVPGTVTVQFDEEMTLLIEKELGDVSSIATRSPRLGSILEEMGVRTLRRVFPDAGEFEERTRREGLHRFYHVEFDPETAPTKAASDLSAVPGVVSVTPQLPVRLRAFNDPYFGSQWHFVNARYKGADINVQKVWDEFTTGNRDVIVSVVDEGVYMDHVDLSDNLIPCLEDGTGSYNFNNDTPTVVPTQGHGTHVAGIISAVSNNGIGVAGIAGGDAGAGIGGVRVMSCQIFDLYGNSPDIYQAIKHGADHGAVILQCSWGFSPDMDGDGFTSDEEIELYRSYTIDDLPEYKAAIDYFIKYAGCDNAGNQLPDSPMKGGVAIFAAGNDNFDYDPLVSYDPVIAVGAFGATGNKASYSNYGDWLDIAAPGGDAKQGIYSTLLSNSYGGSDWQGTSMACPHVSGVAALLVSYFGGPGFTAEECRSRLLRGAVANAFPSSRYIGRKLDAYGAFTCDPDAPVQAPEMAWTGEVPSQLRYHSVVEVPFSVTDPSGQKVWVSLSPEIPGVSLVSDGDSAYRIVLDGEAIGQGKYAITVKARNEDQASSTLSLAFSVMENRIPMPGSAVPSSLVVEGPGKHLTDVVSGWFEDPDGDPLSYEVEPEDPSVAVASVTEDGSLTVEGLRFGSTSLSVRVSDGYASNRIFIPLAVRNPEGSYVYPTVASDVIHVVADSVTPVTAVVDIVSSTGSIVSSKELTADVCHPVTLPVRDLAPGRYSVRIAYSGTTESVSFVKI